MPTSSPRGRSSAKPTAPPEPVLFPRSQVACGLCGLCCTYVTVEIDPPNSVSRASLILWYLYHESVSICWDQEQWLVQFATRCRFFADDRSCEIYARRPDICRDYDERDCEVNAADELLQFYEPAEFLDWLAQRRPKLHARLVAAKFVPDAAMLRRPVPARKPLAAFAKRSRALRDLGAVKITEASVSTTGPAAASAARKPSTPAATGPAAVRRASRSRPVPR